VAERRAGKKIGGEGEGLKGEEMEGGRGGRRKGDVER